MDDQQIDETERNADARTIALMACFLSGVSALIQSLAIVVTHSPADKPEDFLVSEAVRDAKQILDAAKEIV